MNYCECMIDEIELMITKSILQKKTLNILLNKE